MFKWLENRRKLKADRSFVNGYAWAAGKLLAGATADEIEDYTYSPPYYNAFDRGADKALYDWKRLMRKSNDV